MYRFLKAIARKYLRSDPLPQLLRRGLSVGHNFVMLEEVIIDPSHCWHISIGDDVTLAPRVHILAHDASTKRHLGFTRIGKVTVGDKVFVGASTIILPGVAIGSNVIIGAGSVVTKDIPSGSVAAGNPARVICSLEDFLTRRREELSIGPCFGGQQTVREDVSEAMKAEMNRQMRGRIGYVE